jgi:hypothetical protein
MVGEREGGAGTALEVEASADMAGGFVGEREEDVSLKCW